jgi:hypothetical protein
MRCIHSKEIAWFAYIVKVAKRFRIAIAKRADHLSAPPLK